MKSNIEYRSDDIEEFYKAHRIHWHQLYESERVVMEKLGLSPDLRVLDIGCGCGGLGLALRERFGIKHYTGVEINEKAAKTAEALYPQAQIIHGDILSVSNRLSQLGQFDLVISLGCVDWNVQFEEMIRTAFALVKEGGYFLSSFRMTDQESVTEMSKSYQFVNFVGQRTGEIAPYVVFNVRDLIRMLKSQMPSEIMGYGYAGKPSDSAVTPFETVYFVVLALRKPSHAPPVDFKMRLEIPQNLLGLLNDPI